MNDYVLAVDLGGTNLRVAAVDVTGRILHHAKSPTPRSHDGKEIVKLMAELAARCRQALEGHAALAIGAAIPATLDTRAGRVLRAPNLPELDGFELGKAIADELDIPVIIENDATSAAIGENWLGSSRGVQNSICITLGTGVGGGIIINGEPLRGPDGTAGEIGHVCVEPLGVPCGCGSNGCLEQYSSASAVVRMAGEALANHPESTLNKCQELTALEIYNAGIAGDALAKSVFAKMGYYLGILAAGLINVLNPEMVVLGGGLSAGWDLFVEDTREQIAKRAFKEPAIRARLVRASLGDDAGIIGAAHLAFSLK
jgi:glucokinase